MDAVQAQLQANTAHMQQLMGHIDTIQTGITDAMTELQQQQQLLDAAEDNPDAALVVNPIQTIQNMGYASLQEYTDHMQDLADDLPGLQALLAQLQQHLGAMQATEQQLQQQVQALDAAADSDDSTGTLAFSDDEDPMVGEGSKKKRKRQAARNRRQVLPYYAQTLARYVPSKRPVRMPERQHYKQLVLDHGGDEQLAIDAHIRDLDAVDALLLMRGDGYGGLAMDNIGVR
jgi:prefoldin subunit 5